MKTPFLVISVLTYTLAPILFSGNCWAQEPVSQTPAEKSTSNTPNILLILADDLGYGDVGCYNPDSKIPTPNLDKLAGQGMRFTDAHSPCTVCTPTRFSLMTGEMAFRTPNGGRVFSGAGGPSLIRPGQLTLPEMLRKKGYSTACFGKWHVGLTFYNKEGKPIHKGLWFRSVLWHGLLPNHRLVVRLHRRKKDPRSSDSQIRQIDRAQTRVFDRLSARHAGSGF